MKQFIVLGVVGLFAAVSVAQAQQPIAAQRSPSQPPVGPPRSPSLQPAKQYRVVDLKSGSAVIDQPGNYVLNRSWSFKDLPDAPLNIIDIVADDVVLDFRGFEIEVGGRMLDMTSIAVIRVQGASFTLRNATVTICCGEQGSALRSTGNLTQIEELRGYSLDVIALDGPTAVVRDSAFHARKGVRLSSSGTVENTLISCAFTCLTVVGDDNKLLNSRIEPADFLGLRISGNGNMITGNILDYPGGGPELRTGFEVRGDNNVIKDNTLASRGEMFVAVSVSGTHNVIDGNLGAALSPEGSIGVGIRFTQNGNFYGDNRMNTTVPFDLGGTTQTDWGGNVGY